MVRVLHHLDEPEVYFKEIGRVLKSSSSYIQEFANKMHIKARIKALFRGDLSFFHKKPYQQPTIGNFEGTTNQPATFLNYHPKHIRKLFRLANIKILKRFGCSYLRIPFLKKNLNTKILIKIERFLQKIFSWSNISPSIFFIGKSIKPTLNEKRFRSLEEILVCPNCKSTLIFSGNSAKCNKCNKEYSKYNNIWDFRVD